MVATSWPDFISATATCMATVDFPDPPFSLPTTITRADVARLEPSTNMRAPLENLIELSLADSDIGLDSRIYRKREFQRCSHEAVARLTRRRCQSLREQASDGVQRDCHPVSRS